jgi:hypothetical protein
MEFQKRLALLTATERNTSKRDLALLSAALAAAGRGRSNGIPEEGIRQELSESRESISSFAALWPSKATRKQYAIKRAAKSRRSTPEVKSVDNQYLVSTGFYAGTDNAKMEDVIKDGDLEEESRKGTSPVRSIGPGEISFHKPNLEQQGLTSALVKSFLQGQELNYTALSPYLHASRKTGRVLLFWLTNSLVGVSWGDDDSEMSVKPSPTPKYRKRKRS